MASVSVTSAVGVASGDVQRGDDDGLNWLESIPGMLLQHKTLTWLSNRLREIAKIENRHGCGGSCQEKSKLQKE